MTPPERETRTLPQVEEADLLSLIFKDVTDPLHRERWHHFATSQPVLAREVLRRAYDASHAGGEHLSPLDAQKHNIDAVTFAVAALESAVRREKALLSAVDDADVANPPPLGEPRDGRQADAPAQARPGF